MYLQRTHTHTQSRHSHVQDTVSNGRKRCGAISTLYTEKKSAHTFKGIRLYCV